MIKLQTLHLDQIGAEDARFLRLTVPLSDPVTAEPSDSVLWIRNGGGKTSLLSLLFSLFLPAHRQFVWTKTEGRTLGDYVQSGDTSLVAATVVVDGAPVVVGAYYEWPDRQRPAEHRRRASELHRVWFVFTPDGSGLDLASIPRVDDAGRLLTLTAGVAELTRLSRTHTGLQLAICRNQSDYATALVTHGIDTGLLEAQLQVVGQEGGFEKMFTTTTDLGFVNRLVDLLLDERATDSLSERISHNAELLRRLPALELERMFATELSALLMATATAAADLSTTAEVAVTAQHAADHLATGLLAAGRRAGGLAVEHDAAAQAAQARTTALYASRTIAGTEERAYLHREAVLERAAAAAACELASAARTAARELADAWGLVDQVIATASAAERLSELEATQRSLEEGAEVQRLTLERAGGAYRARLDSVITEAAGRATTTRATQAQVEATLATLRAEIAEIDAARQDATVALRGTAARLEELEAAEVRALSDGDLIPGESVTRAQDRWAAALIEHQTAAIAARARIDLSERTLSELEPRLATAAEERTAATEAARAATAAHSALEARRADLARRPVVTATLGTEQVDLWAARSTLISRLYEMIDGAETETGAGAAELARLGRSLAALADSGVLAPEDDVTDVLAALAQAGVLATSGYAYLTHSVPPEQWGATLEAQPALCSGIVVDPAALPAARAALDGFDPTRLVVVGTKAALEAGAARSPAPHLVVGPLAAAYDPDAAPVLLAALGARRGALVSRLGDVKRELSMARELRTQLETFYADAPATTTLAHLATTASENAELAATATEVLAGLQGERTSATAAARDARTAGDAAQGGITESQRRVDRLASLADRLAARPELQRTRAAAQSDLQRLDARKVAATTTQTDQEAARRAALDELAAIARDAERFTEERRAVGEGPSGQLLVGVDLADLRTRWRTAVDELSRAITDIELNSRIDEARRQVAAHRRRLDEQPPAVVAEAARLVADVPDAVDGVTRKRALDLARAEAEHRVTAESQARDSLAEWTRALSEREPVATASELIGDVTDPATARTGAERARADFDRLRDEATAAERERDTEAATETTLRTEATTLAAASQSLEAAGAVIGDLSTNGAASGGDEPARTAPDVPLRPDASVMPWDGPAAQAQAVATEASRLLRTANSAADAAVAQHRTATEQVRDMATAEPYQSLDRTLLRPVGDLTVTILSDGREATRQSDAWRVRSAELAEEMARVGTHRAICVDDLAGEVTQMLAKLGRASAVSKMPAGLGAWAGKPFLKINFTNPSDDIDAFHSRVGDAIDALVEKKTEIGGPELLKAAIAAAVPAGFRVRLYKPTPDMRDEHRRVTDLGSWSGGERLTAAVLLFCVVAAIRADRTGSRSFAPGVLIIDNPLGQASYQPFVLLQRRIASLMGVQLLYTTGIKDMPAIGTFPNLVRFANQSHPVKGAYLQVKEVTSTGGFPEADATERTATAVRVHRTGPVPDLATWPASARGAQGALALADGSILAEQDAPELATGPATDGTTGSPPTPMRVPEATPATTPQAAPPSAEAADG